MRYNSIVYNDVVNGEGMRISLFVQGCSHKCNGCFNKESWDFKGGHEFTKDTLNNLMLNFKLYSSGYTGLSILGGEPFDNLDLCNLVVDTFRKQFLNTKNIWIWSGYTLDELIVYPNKLELLKKCDVLVDGKFNENLYKILSYRGSSNQRIINIQQSLKQKTTVLLDVN